MIEIMIVKLSLYLLGHANASAALGFFDVLAFVGYKYVGLCINMLVAMILAGGCIIPLYCTLGCAWGISLCARSKPRLFAIAT